MSKGDIHKVAHPFCKFDFEDGTHSWTVGCEKDQDDGGCTYFYAHGQGLKVMTEISRYTPEGYGEKVFFTVQYIDPDGNPVGKKKLQMLGAQAFKNRVSGFSLDYELEPTQ